MKLTLNCVFFFAIALAISCSKEQQNLTKQLNITVIDEVNNQVIDSAQVRLRVMFTADSYVWSEEKLTNSKGLCSFTFELKPQAEYSVVANKDGFWHYLVNDSASISHSIIHITENTEPEQVLYLTSDPNQNNDYWREMMPHYEMDSLIKLLRTDEYNSSFPYLVWNDIPHLMEVACDSTMITRFPRNMLSSYSQDSCFLGIISIWLIESIRLTEKNKTYKIFGNLPSLNPILKYNDRTISRTEKNNLPEMKLAYDLYLQWWEEVKDMDKEHACRINPLEHSEIDW